MTKCDWDVLLEGMEWETVKNMVTKPDSKDPLNKIIMAFKFYLLDVCDQLRQTGLTLRHLTPPYIKAILHLNDTLVTSLLLSYLTFPKIIEHTPFALHRRGYSAATISDRNPVQLCGPMVLKEVICSEDDNEVLDIPGCLRFTTRR
jgi:hypothetical protein